MDWWYGMGCNGMIINEIPLFGLANNGWNGMELDGIHFISS